MRRASEEDEEEPGRNPSDKRDREEPGQVTQQVESWGLTEKWGRKRRNSVAT